MIYIGVDPGAKGAIAVIDQNGDYTDHMMYNESWFENAKYLSFLKEKTDGKLLVGLEKVASAGGNGVKSSFSFGVNVGGWLATLQILAIPYVLVPPPAWQPKMLGAFPKGDSKKAASAYVERRYPDLKLLKKEQGVADALCIALYVSKY